MKNDCFYILSRGPTHQGADILPPSFFQDRCGQSWLSRTTCVLQLPSRINVKQVTSCTIFKWKRKRTLRIACAFIVNRSGGCVMVLQGKTVHFYVPPASTRGVETTAAASAAVAATAAAPHRQTTETRPALAGEGKFTTGGSQTSKNRRIWRLFLVELDCLKNLGNRLIKL